MGKVGKNTMTEEKFGGFLGKGSIWKGRKRTAQTYKCLKIPGVPL